MKVAVAALVQQQASHRAILALTGELARHFMTQVELEREIQELDAASHDQGDSFFIIGRVWKHSAVLPRYWLPCFIDIGNCWLP
ncbi:hypothetical protein D3C84_689370 [compost metagenome]